MINIFDAYALKYLKRMLFIHITFTNVTFYIIYYRYRTFWADTDTTKNGRYLPVPVPDHITSDNTMLHVLLHKDISPENECKL